MRSCWRRSWSDRRASNSRARFLTFKPCPRPHQLSKACMQIMCGCFESLTIDIENLCAWAPSGMQHMSSSGLTQSRMLSSLYSNFCRLSMRGVMFTASDTTVCTPTPTTSFHAVYTLPPSAFDYCTSLSAESLTLQIQRNLLPTLTQLFPIHCTAAKGKTHWLVHFLPKQQRL